MDHEHSFFKKIRKIEFYSSHLAEDFLAGAYLSAFRGKGMEFEEVRTYQVGDDIRSIDWNVTARMNYPHIKIFKEERELAIILIVDISSSTFFGTARCLKSELITEVAAVLAFSAIKNNDRVSLLLFSDQVEKYLPPKKGVRHVLQIIRELLAYSPKERGSQLEKALSFISRVQQKRAICFLISDFMYEIQEKFLAPLSKKYDLIPIMVSDPKELILPKMGLANFSDLETGKKFLIDTSSPVVQSHFAEVTTQHCENQKKLMQKLGLPFLTLSTDKPYIALLKNFFSLRSRTK